MGIYLSERIILTGCADGWDDTCYVLVKKLNREQFAKFAEFKEMGDADVGKQIDVIHGVLKEIFIRGEAKNSEGVLEQITKDDLKALSCVPQFILKMIYQLSGNERLKEFSIPEMSS